MRIMPVDYPTPLSIAGVAFCKGSVGSDGGIDCSLATISQTLGGSEEEIWELLLPLMKMTKSSIKIDETGDLVLSVFTKAPAAKPRAMKDLPKTIARPAVRAPEKPAAERSVGEQNEDRIVDAIIDLEKTSKNVLTRADLATLANVKRGSLHGAITRLVDRRAIRETKAPGGRFRYEVL